MKLYLISKNPIINKLVALSASKLGVEMVESQELDASISAEIVLMDDECFEVEIFETYKADNATAKMILFYSKAAERIEGFDSYIQKPFLPTDLVKTLSEISGISIEDATKKSVESDILELDSNDDLGELNLDEELDFSNLDDLDLEDNQALKLDDNDAPLDFGGDDGLESKENAEEQDLQVLDKGDVDTIKDLLDDSKEAVDDPLLGFDLDKELGEISNNMKDIEPSKEKVAQELEVAEQKEENQEVALEALEEAGSDFGLEEIMGEDSEDIEAVENVESKTENMELDLSDFDLGIEEDDTKQSSSDESDEIKESETFNLEDLELGNEESTTSTESLDSLESSLESNDGESLGSIENTQELENADELENLQSFNIEETTMESKDEDLENLDATMDLEETAESKDELANLESSLESSLNSEETKSNNENLENLESDFTETSNVSSNDCAESMASGDEFSALSLEEMGEALGEPIQKEPLPAPFVAQEPQKQEAQLPSNIQANSLESLIGALQTLQTQSLKELLSGATINISIQFPKKDEN
ncbi:hypothetical protein [uncultured Helicobacter sp.]|uniref:hypothetical protein n=1 Tax=uncultured Helicobacter sp. TaxID=175537 RepID=UPI0026322B12|nr:hypothetical protein [uncultured Helicobacter sp.]